MTKKQAYIIMTLLALLSAVVLGRRPGAAACGRGCPVKG